MPKRPPAGDGDAPGSPAKAPRAAAGGRKRAPKVVYAEPEEIRRFEPAESMESFASGLAPRTPEHLASRFKVVCWNVASLRALVRKGGGFRAWCLAESPDVLILNEHKLDASLVLPPGETGRRDADDATGGAGPRQASLDAMLGRSKPQDTGGKGSAPAAASASAPAAPGGRKRKAAKPVERFNAASLFGEGVFAHEEWACSVKKGYAGVVAFSRQAPEASSTGLGDPDLDHEGRVVTLEWPGLAVVGCYTPNSGMKLDRLEYRTGRWDPAFRAHLLDLERRRGRVVVVGDLNVAFRDFDVYDAKRMRNKQAGFCDGERASMAALLAPRGVTYAAAPEGGAAEAEAPPGGDGSAAAAASASAAPPPPPQSPLSLATGITQSAPGCGFVDTWLARGGGNARCAEYSFFSMRFGMRAKNKGWRLDYALASEALAPSVSDSYTRSAMVGSDHLPIGVEFDRSVLARPHEAGAAAEP